MRIYRQKVTEQEVKKPLILLTLVIIFVTDSLFFAINADQSVQIVKRFSVIALAVIMMSYHVFILKRGVSKHIIFLSLSVLASSLFAGYFVNGFYYYTFIASVWIGFVYSRYYSLEDFSDAFCKIMRVVAITSVLFFVFADKVSDSGWFPIVTSAKGNEYAFLGITNIPLKIHQRTRNFGPFWEPGTYQIYLNVALYLTLFVQKKNKRVLDAVIFVVTGLTTLSGAVLVPMLVIIAAYAFERKNIKAFVLVVVIVIGVLIVIYNGLIDSVLLKMTGENDTNSLTYRWIGLLGGLKGFIRNPLFGSSPSDIDAIRTQLAQTYLGSDYGSSVSTYANLLAYFGAYVGTFFIVSSWRVFASASRNRIVVFMVFLAFFLAVSNENMTTSVFFVTFCFLRSVSYTKTSLTTTTEKGCA